MELVPLSDAALAQAVAWHRQVAAMVEAADRAGVAVDDLPELRSRLSAQAVLLAQAASRLGAALPALVPAPTEVATAGANLGDLSPSAVATATRTMRNTLAAVDAALSPPDTGRTAAPPAPPARAAPGGAFPESAVLPVQTAPPPSAPPAPSASDAWSTTDTSGAPDAWSVRPGGPAEAVAEAARRSVGLRNAAVYAAYAAVVLVVQAVLFVLLDESTLPAAAPLCLLILPAFAWAAGWLSIGALFTAGPDGMLDRTARVGIAICMIPNALLCGAVGVLFLINTLR